MIKMTPEQVAKRASEISPRAAIKLFIREMEKARTSGEDQRFHQLGKLLEEQDGYIFCRVRQAL
jgi:hypothetical protein